MLIADEARCRGPAQGLRNHMSHLSSFSVLPYGRMGIICRLAQIIRGGDAPPTHPRSLRPCVRACYLLFSTHLYTHLRAIRYEYWLYGMYVVFVSLIYLFIPSSYVNFRFFRSFFTALSSEWMRTKWMDDSLGQMFSNSLLFVYFLINIGYRGNPPSTSKPLEDGSTCLGNFQNVSTENLIFFE